MSERCQESRRTVEFVKECPLDEEQWEKRKKLKDCSKITNATCNHERPLEFHCLLNAHRNKSIEVCAPNTVIPADTCPDYSLKGERINGAFNCKSLLGANCPKKQYKSNSIIKYKHCIMKARSPQDASAPFTSGHLAVVILIGVLLIALIVYLLYKYVKYRRLEAADGFWSFLRHSWKCCSGQLGSRGEEEEQLEEQCQLIGDIRILLVGRTGSGKSSTGNTILGYYKFDTKLAAESVTKRCVKGSAMIGKQNVYVIDTPGLFDTEKDDEKEPQFNNMKKLAEPGPTAIILVIAAGSIRPEDLKTLDRISDRFGETLKRRGIVLFTKRDHLEKENQNLESYLNTAPQKLNDLVCELKGPIAFDNTAEGKKKEDQVSQLISLINSF